MKSLKVEWPEWLNQPFLRSRRRRYKRRCTLTCTAHFVGPPELMNWFSWMRRWRKKLDISNYLSESKPSGIRPLVKLPAKLYLHILIPSDIHTCRSEYLQNRIPAKLNAFLPESLQTRIPAELNTCRIEYLLTWMPADANTCRKWIPAELNTCRIEYLQNPIPAESNTCRNE